MPPKFSAESLRFLRALKRNNDREWFRARREEYDRVVRDPMIAVIEQLARDFARFAPELSASPKTSLYRIYRDTRFSEDKSPLKTQVAASFKRVLGELEGDRLTRVPRGYAADDPAAAYLRFRHFLVGREFPPAFATTPTFYPALLETFKAAMPLVRFLNEPLVEHARTALVPF